MQIRRVMQAVEQGDAKALAALIAGNPDLRRARDPNGISALLHALYRKQSPLVDLLRHDDIDGFEAAALGAVESLMLLLARDNSLPARVASDGYTALHLAAFFGQPATARLLIAAGADVDARAANETGMRPLHAAVAAANSSVAAQLLVVGADPNLEQAGGWTPLHLAAARGRTEIVELLLEHGADRDALADDGRKPWRLADDGGHLAVLDRLRSGAEGE